MKKILILSVIAASSLFATNGSNLIGLGVESRALGGTGIAMSQGAENALSNPALLGKTKANHEFSFGGTVFDSTVKITTTAGRTSNPGKGVSKTSAQDKSMIPVVALSNRINANLVFGLGMYGTAGMGTDWRGSAFNAPLGAVDLYNMRSSLMLMQFAPSLAYSKDNYGIGLSAIMQYGQLSIDFDAGQNPSPQLGPDGKFHMTPAQSGHVGNGPSQDYGYGYQLGGFYDFTKNITVAAVYKSSIDMEYKDQISKAAMAFGYGVPKTPQNNPMAGKSDHLEQPAEIGFGISIKNKSMTYTVDYKTIKWADAKGYKDFGWENQNVLALGAKYTTSKYWLGLGYNSANNPIPENKSKKFVGMKNASLNATSGSAANNPIMNTDGDTMNLLNYAMFPATITKAFTFGGGYSLNKDSSISLAYMMAPEVSDTVSAITVGVGMVTTKHSQSATTVAYKYKF